MDAETTREVSRRTLIKRAGAGAALAWSAPVLLSISPQAYAASGAPCPSDGCNKGNICDVEGACGVNNNERCSCLHTTDPGNPTFCSDTDLICDNQVCTSCADCPSGWACITSCCPDSVCAPPCTNAAAAVAHMKGKLRASL